MAAESFRIRRRSEATISSPRMAGDGDDERKAESLPVSGGVLGEGAPFPARQRGKIRPGLFGLRTRGQGIPTRLGKRRMRRQQSVLLVLAGVQNDSAKKPDAVRSPCPSWRKTAKRARRPKASISATSPKRFRKAASSCRKAASKSAHSYRQAPPPHRPAIEYFLRQNKKIRRSPPRNCR